VRPPNCTTHFIVVAAWLACSISVFADEDALCPNEEPSPSPKQLEGSVTAAHDSKYVFRGVNSLPGSGIATTDAELNYQHFSLEIWQAKGVSKSYDELDFTFKYTCEKKPFIFSGGYINYYTPNDDQLRLGYSDTQELFVEVEWDSDSYYTATLKYNYDFDKIRGGFIEPRFGLFSLATIQDGLRPVRLDHVRSAVQLRPVRLEQFSERNRDCPKNKRYAGVQCDSGDERPAHRD
jgi:hypothetical protein